MALSTAARKRLEVAMAHRATAKEVADAIDLGGNAQAAAVADLGQTISDPPTDVEVQAISDKVDELLASLRAAGLMAS